MTESDIDKIHNKAIDRSSAKLVRRELRAIQKDIKTSPVLLHYIHEKIIDLDKDYF